MHVFGIFPDPLKGSVLWFLTFSELYVYSCPWEICRVDIHHVTVWHGSRSKCLCFTLNSWLTRNLTVEILSTRMIFWLPAKSTQIPRITVFWHLCQTWQASRSWQDYLLLFDEAVLTQMRHLMLLDTIGSILLICHGMDQWIHSSHETSRCLIKEFGI